ncbi:hypothetical protein I7I53_10772 [Histoplasma capsulatum var. duboisii H88]|nr:hypothetical protein I7I53_10772 [Histoplasma capsulatum var. duboisii H88]
MSSPSSPPALPGHPGTPSPALVGNRATVSTPRVKRPAAAMVLETPSRGNHRRLTGGRQIHGQEKPALFRFILRNEVIAEVLVFTDIDDDTREN